jgi:hypothetical protein
LPARLDLRRLLDSFDISLSQLLSWNAWLVDGDCTTALFATVGDYEDRSVCIGVGAGATSVIPISTTTKSASGSGSATKTTTSTGPTQTGVVSGCQLFYATQDGDTCPSIESKYCITAAQFYEWNPSIYNTCSNM